MVSGGLLNCCVDYGLKDYAMLLLRQPDWLDWLTSSKQRANRIYFLINDLFSQYPEFFAC